MASILGATVLTRRVAGWVHHRAPGPQPVSVAELHQTCDRLARSVEEPSLCSRELAALTRELQHLIRQVEQYAADTSARQGRMQELARAHSLIQETLQEVLTATPYPRAPYGLCLGSEDARATLQHAIWQTRYTLILLSWSTTPVH